MRRLTMFVLAGAAASVSAQSTTPIDGFETYVDDDALRAAWIEDGSAAPLPIFLEQQMAAGGMNALRLEYDTGVDPFFGRVRRSFDDVTDLRQFWKVRWNWKRTGSSSVDEVLIESANADFSGESAFQFLASTGDVPTSFEPQEFNLTQEGGRFLEQAEDIGIVVRGATDFGAGTLFFDDFEFVGLPPEDVVIEDFESFADDGDLTNTWPPTSFDGGGGTNAMTSLITTTERGQALRLSYNNGADPFFSQTAIDFGEPQDFSGFATVTVYYQPFFDGPPFANSLENVEIKLEDAAFQNIASITADQGSQAPFFEWTPLVLDLSAVPDAELQSVQRIALSITPIDFGAGTVLFDDITASLSDESPLDLNGDGSVDSGDIVTLISAAPLERIEDFEGFADTAELAAAITDATPNATIELDPMAGVDNSAALVATGENGSDPFFTQFTLDTDDFSLAGVDQVSLAGRFLSGSNEDVRVELLDDVGGTIAVADLGSVQALPTDSFATLPIVTDFSSATVFSVRFTLDAVDFGTTSVAIDNITSGDPVSDFNGDGAGNIFDLIDYLEEFDAN